MESIVPHAETDSSSEIVAVPDTQERIDSAPKDIRRIVWYYEEKIAIDDDAEANSVRMILLLSQWYEWCDRTYPTHSLGDLKHIVEDAFETIDIRLLVKVHIAPGYSILLFLEACYAVDKALCGTNKDALAKVRAWHIPQEMKAYKYLLSEDMKLWWAAELTELENEMKSPFSSRVALSWKLDDLKRCLERLLAIMECGDGIGTNIWTAIEEGGWIMPAGLYDGIYERYYRLKNYVRILSTELAQREQRDMLTNILPSPIFASRETGAYSPSGVRRRIPRASSPSTYELDAEISQHSRVDGDTNPPVAGGLRSNTSSEMNIARFSHHVPSVRIDSLLDASLYPPGLNYLATIYHLTGRYIRISAMKYRSGRALRWLFHKETAFVVSLCCVVISAVFMAKSAILTNSLPMTQSGKTSVESDPNFSGTVSQIILSNLSIYLIIASMVHKRPENIHYRSWLWVCLFTSFFSSVLGAFLYFAVPIVSVVFLWTAAFAQVVIPVLLILNAGSSSEVEDIELHAD